MSIGRGHPQRGFALVLTLWVLSALSILLLTFAMQVRTNVRAASYQRSQVQAEYLARSAIARIAVELVDRSQHDEATAPESRLGTWRIDPTDWSVVERPDPRRSRSRRAASPSRGEIVCEVLAEEALLPLARLWAPIGRELGIPERASPFVQKEDLLALRSLPDPRVRKAIDDLYPLVTTFTDGRVFINDASREVLERIPGVDALTAAAFVLRIEREGPFARMFEIGDVLGVTPAEMGSLEDWFTLSPRYFRVRSSSDGGTAVEGIVDVDGEEARVIQLRKVRSS